VRVERATSTQIDVGLTFLRDVKASCLAEALPESFGRGDRAVRVARQVYGDAIDEERDVRAVIGVEAAQKVLVGLAPRRRAAR
jgi:hypothetical protein